MNLYIKKEGMLPLIYIMKCDAIFETNSNRSGFQLIIEGSR